MKIQKYKANIVDSNIEVIGYIIEVRKHTSKGTYSEGTDYLISVTEKSMANGFYGVFKVDEKSIQPQS